MLPTTVVLLSLLLLLSLATGQAPTQTCPAVLRPHAPRVVGGTPASTETARYVAAVFRGSSFTCSAAVLSSRWLLTAAHCLLDELTDARLGGLNAWAGTKVFIDEYFTPPPKPGPALPPFYSSDIALLHLASDAPSSTVFARVNIDSTVPNTRAFTRIAGYGRIADESSVFGSLRQVDVPVVALPVCRRDWYWWIPDDSICSGYMKRSGCGACNGDSGGPLLQLTASGDPVVVGVTSGGVACGLAGFPDFFTRVSSHISWMRSVGAVFTTASDAKQVFASPSPAPATPVASPSPPACPVVLYPHPPYNAPPGSIRIIGGDDSSALTARYMVSLVGSAGDLICSGVLLSRRWVLTNADCRVTTNSAAFIGGRHSISGFPTIIEKVYKGPGAALGLSDVMLVQLWNESRDTERFAIVNDDDSVPAAGAFVRAVGYGVEDAADMDRKGGKLRQVDVPVLSNCRTELNVTANEMCAGYESGSCGSCRGDEGGPLLQFDDKGRPVLIGVVLRGAGCPRPNFPGVYLRLSKFVSWMNSVGADFQTGSNAQQVFDRSSPFPTPSPTPTTSSAEFSAVARPSLPANATPSQSPKSSPKVSAVASPSSVANVTSIDDLESGGDGGRTTLIVLLSVGGALLITVVLFVLGLVFRRSPTLEIPQAS